MSDIKYVDQPTSNLADQAAATADNAIKSTQRATNEAFDSLSGGVQNLRQQAAPALERATQQASALAQRGVDTMRDTAQQVRESALRASDSTVNYIKDEPVKAMLIAAATGAGLMALLSLLTRSGNRG